MNISAPTDTYIQICWVSARANRLLCISLWFSFALLTSIDGCCQFSCSVWACVVVFSSSSYACYLRLLFDFNQSLFAILLIFRHTFIGRIRCLNVHKSPWCSTKRLTKNNINAFFLLKNCLFKCITSIFIHINFSKKVRMMWYFVVIFNRKYRQIIIIQPVLADCCISNACKEQ